MREKTVDTSLVTDQTAITSETVSKSSSPHNSGNFPENVAPGKADRLTTIREGSASLEESRMTVLPQNCQSVSHDAFDQLLVSDLTQIPASEEDQIKQISAAIRIERKANGWSRHIGEKFSQDFTRRNGVQLSPQDIIRAELKDRDKRAELNHEKSPLLLKLVSLYNVCIFEVLQQMPPIS